MANNLIMKRIFVSAFRELLTRNPLSKITIKDITDACEVSRNTFYYHFADKYELINWYFNTEIIQKIEDFYMPENSIGNFLDLCERLYEDRKFWLACFQYEGQNSLYECIYNAYYEMWTICNNIKYSEAGFRLTENELNMIAKVQAQSIVSIIRDWVNSGMRGNYMSHFEQIYKIVEFGGYGYSIMNEKQEYERENDSKRDDKRLEEQERNRKIC